MIFLLIGLCYDWRHQKKCFKHLDHKIVKENQNRRISKSEPRSPPPPPTSIQLPIIKPKAPPPPPPLTSVPYLPPIRSQSQPPPNNRVSSPPLIPPQTRVSRPPEPPPPVPLSPPAAKGGTSNGPPVVPYSTRPHISEVAYLKKKFEDTS